MRYSLVMFLVKVVMRLIARVTIYGKENLPGKDVSYVGVSNHIGRLDPIFPYYYLNRKDIIMLVAEKYKEHAWSRVLAQAVNGIFVDRFNADLGAMREVMRRIKKGGLVVIAPEGTRSPNCSLIKGWDGASYVAARTGLPIVPVGVTGTCDKEVMHRLKHFKKLDLKVNVGKAFTLPAYDNRTKGEQLAAYTEEIMCRIAAQLPESYRGIYADHPRLHELLSVKAAQLVKPPLAVG
jgi:1-acyl-sn-glycerol-3-phosphate acyltransferase